MGGESLPLFLVPVSGLRCPTLSLPTRAASMVDRCTTNSLAVSATGGASLLGRFAVPDPLLAPKGCVDGRPLHNALAPLYLPPAAQGGWARLSPTGSSPTGITKKQIPEWVSAFLVPVTGLEPVRFLRRGILSPLCLPIPPYRLEQLLWYHILDTQSSVITGRDSAKMQEGTPL